MSQTESQLISIPEQFIMYTYLFTNLITNTFYFLQFDSSFTYRYWVNVKKDEAQNVLNPTIKTDAADNATTQQTQQKAEFKKLIIIYTQ